MAAPELVLPNTIARRAERAGESIYLAHVDGGEMSYGEAHERSLRWAGALAGLGVARGDTVLLMLPPSFEAVTVWIGAAWLGAIEVPIHTAFRGRLLEHVVTDSRAAVAVVWHEYLERFDELPEAVTGGLRTTVVVGSRRHPERLGGTRPLPCAPLLEQAEPPEPVTPEGHDISSILYTSGTTGPSKGVLIPWAQALATATQMMPLDDLTAGDAWYSPFPLFHASGKIPVYAMALRGGRVVMRDGFSASAFWDDIERFGCSTSLLIGTTAGIVADRKPADRPSPLRNTLMAPLPAEPEAFAARMGIRIATVFNMTEISGPIGTGWELHGRSCGRVRPGYECRVVDEHDRELPDGQAGELIVRADEPWVLTPGYWGLPEKTAEAWRNGWFHTGDVCLRDEEGWFYFLDRTKDAIRRGGENISSMELEAIVVEHPAVLECAAVGVPAEIAEEEVKAVVVVRDPLSFDPAELIDFLTPRVPRFMVPRYVEVVPSLPRTHTEKVRKDELRGQTTGRLWDRAQSAVPR